MMQAVDAAYQVLKQHGQPLDVQDLLDEALVLLGLDREPDRVARMYTEINLDVRFQYRGGAQWGLKEWNPRGGLIKPGGSAARRIETTEDEDGAETEEDDSWQ